MVDRASLTQRVGKTLYHHWRNSFLFDGAARRELKDEGDLSQRQAGSDEDHLRGALAWLCRAHDSTAQRGVARGYAAAWNFHFDARGWQPAYPETTGYLIPTFMDVALQQGQDALMQRALGMADWEIEVQLPSGAVMGGTVEQPPSPAVFNTGQVILGWERAYRQSGQQRYLLAACRAADYLLAVQQAEGQWRVGNSRFADAKTTTYNVRVGWALILLGQTANRPDYIAAGRRNVDATLAMQNDNGWFRCNCLSDPGAPLLHTICYAIEGIAGAALALQHDVYLQRAQLALDHLLPLIDHRGFIPGRLDGNWQGRVEWACLTGSAQLAGQLLLLAHPLQRPDYKEGAARLLAFVKRTQNLHSADPGIRGGIKGSYPFSGGYGRYELLNWAAKFFIDALLLQQQNR
ncbi:conserved hypothetical protein [Magnetococcus marinus MC-1]|uniref:Uncharacterized protein n=1 Tax=Magnetococcus marinus (strain ATCC BAA-1437 / JCM 17883 / MC-1) TaxID=156889 RepID=A0L556_MAGMM|nr:hypothetical protein [Magnetococcus marinus]ABK43099.1 conserved hypothetical protein [Magnetococcus marinus MC-1]